MTVALVEKTYLPENKSVVDHAFVELFKNYGDQAPALITADRRIELPEHVVEILEQVALAMRDGKAISIVPRDTVLSTQKAAEMLGISRPTLVRLLEEGKIPYIQANRHRRVFLRDVVEYQERHRVFAREALADVRAEAASLGEYDQDFDDMQEVARLVRKGR